MADLLKNSGRILLKALIYIHAVKMASSSQKFFEPTYTSANVNLIIIKYSLKNEKQMLQ